MKTHQSLLSTVAAGSILLAAAAFVPLTMFVATPALAATNVSVNISINTFYDRLAPYGDWVSYRGHWVFVPEVEAGWRPYTRGHWVYTDRHGWLWVSNERFGWATFHYGRWGYGRDVGWYWVPGRRWAPAWVAWSRDEDDIGWAPLPPDFDRGDDVSVSISIGRVPEHYWQVVPARAFLSVDLSDHVYRDRDRDRVRRVISRGDIEPVRIENNIVVNNVINVNFIEEKTNKKVVVHEERSADNPEAAGKADDNSVAIFNADVKDEPEAKPKKVKKTEDVAEEKRSKGFKPEETATTEEAAPSTDEAAQPKQGDEQQQTTDEQGNKKKKKPAQTEAAEPQQGEEQQQTTEEQGNEKKKKPAQTEAAQPQQGEEQQATEEQGNKKKKKPAQTEAAQPQQGEEQQQTTEEQSSKKKKKPAAEIDQTQSGNAAGEEPQENAEQTTKKKRNQSEKALEPATDEQAAPAEEQPAKNKKKQKEQCDPTTQDCQAE